MPDDIYHRLTFDHVEDGAAFVAALSRFATSPGNAPSSSSASGASLVALVDRVVGGAHLDVYLNAAALEATSLGFGAPPVIDTRAGEALPASCIRILREGDRRAYGRDDILRLILGAP